MTMMKTLRCEAGAGGDVEPPHATSSAARAATHQLMRRRYRAAPSGGCKTYERDLAVGLLRVLPIPRGDGRYPGQRLLALSALQQARRDLVLLIPNLERDLVGVLGQVVVPVRVGRRP